MKNSKYLLAILLGGCALSQPLAGTSTLVLRPQIQAGSYTQTTINPYTKASIDHLNLELYKGESLMAQRTLSNADLDKVVTFSNLQANGSYRIKALAYTAGNLLISTEDSNSWTDVTLTTDDHPTVAALKVKLINTAFNGQGTGSIQVTAGGYNNAGAEKMGFLLTGIVSTFIGQKGVSGTTDGTGTSAKLMNPIGVAYDGSGNLYVSEQSGHSIRKVVLSTGEVTTIAGIKGSIGTTDGTGTSAQFNQPYAITVDGNGNLYVADTQNNAIRKVVLATREVTTLAGTKGSAGSNDGIGTAAQFNAPLGLAYDGNGNLYVADQSNRVIRKIDVSTKEVTTFAGSKGVGGTTDGTAALFIQPRGLAYDGNGTLYVTDFGSYTIRKINLTTKEVTTLAGINSSAGTTDGIGTSAQFDRPACIALDGNGNLFISDSGNNTIRKLNLTSMQVTTLAGTKGSTGSSDGTGTAAQFYLPYGLVFDGNGFLYVADLSNHAIRQIR